MQEVYQNFSLQHNCDGTHDLIISYDARFDAEFSAESLSLEHMEEGVRSASDYLERFACGLRMRSAKIVAGGAVMAVVPIAVAVDESNCAKRRAWDSVPDGRPWRGTGVQRTVRAGGMAGVVTRRCRLRAAPFREGEEVSTVLPGAVVAVLDTLPGGWRKVRTSEGAEGYLLSRRLCETACRSADIRANTAPLDLLHTPSPTADSFGTVPVGERMLYLGSERGFDKVSYGSITAYVVSGHLRSPQGD